MNKIIFEKVGTRLKQARELNNITLEEAGKMVDVHKSTVLRWENGETEKIKLPVIEILAKHYNVNPVWLMGYDVPMKTTLDKNKNKAKIPILGTVKAGYNWLAEENVIGYITDRDTVKDYEKNINEYFALKVIGDSMLPLLSDGDLVIVHDQDDVESGQTAVILINGEEATVKKVVKTNEGIELHAMNPYYPIKKFTFEDMKSIPIKIIGRVKEAKIKGAFE